MGVGRFGCRIGRLVPMQAKRRAGRRLRGYAAKSFRFFVDASVVSCRYKQNVGRADGYAATTRLRRKIIPVLLMHRLSRAAPSKTSGGPTATRLRRKNAVYRNPCVATDPRTNHSLARPSSRWVFGRCM